MTSSIFLQVVRESGTGFQLIMAGNESPWMGGNCCKASSSLMVETLALLEALKAVQFLQLPVIEINIDSYGGCQHYQGINPIPWSLQNLLPSIEINTDSMELE
ncbi:hypothetical protein MUK42_25622 [Musa troglodytarum]|uniref:Uncharacterized protein n=1 Tax=Musa troglodytarum TaxID=320322 RepID=A0A9E7HGR8_9LILI|nr:hypothetical protein MUK42_25622 [Musa troglodytarum]